MLRLPPLARASVAAVLALVVAAGATPVTAAPPQWKQDIAAAIGNRDVSVAVGLDRGWLYRHGAWRQRAPASNQKLLLSMALLHRTSLTTRLRTELFAKGATTAGVLRGNLWIVGHGDPSVGMPTMRALARAGRRGRDPEDPRTRDGCDDGLLPA